jgi:hypothetical protein
MIGFSYVKRKIEGDCAFLAFLALLAISDWCFCLFWRDETRKSGKLEVVA